MVARHGSVELTYLTMGLGLEKLVNNAGFFPQDNRLGKRFKDEYTEHCRNIDVLCAWNYRHGFFKQEEKLFNLAPNCQLSQLASLSPFRYKEPWSAALAGKDILVVHPFKETILKQYEKRKDLFENPNILSDLNSLNVVKAVQSIANQKVPFENWFEALAYMQDEIAKHDFDIALIGCGAYGLPLASFVKSLGKQAIHVGGALQLLFGIKGKRWDGGNYNYKEIYYNDSWVFPAKSETPEYASKVENACYW